MLERLIANHPASFAAATSAINHRLIEAAVISIIQTSLHRDKSLGYQFDSPDLARIFPCLRAMHNAPENSWSIVALAKMAGMSKTLFAGTFKNVTGETPGRYLGTLRFERARELLRQGSLPLADIAHRIGYGSDMAFIRGFKRQFGISPGRFRSARD